MSAELNSSTTVDSRRQMNNDHAQFKISPLLHVLLSFSKKTKQNKTKTKTQKNKKKKQVLRGKKFLVKEKKILEDEKRENREVEGKM